MQAYGSRRNYNFSDDFIKNEEARSTTKQRKLTKLMRRMGRRTAKQELKK